MKGATTGTTASEWEQLELHFHRHAALIERFRHASPSTVQRLWRAGRNEAGAPLSRFEREALIERYCEVFGAWPS
jgi:hypothetical protein